MAVWSGHASSRGTLGRILLRQASGELFQPLVAARVHLSSSGACDISPLTATWTVDPAFPEDSAGRVRLAKLSQNTAGWDVNDIALVSGGTPPTWCCLGERVDYNAAKLPECLGHPTHGASAVPLRALRSAVFDATPVGLNVVGRKCLENALGLVYHWQLMNFAGVVATNRCRRHAVVYR